MSTTVNRRTALGFGTAATAGLVFGTGSGASAAPTPDRGAATDAIGPAERRVGKIYYRASTEAGGTWRARISVNAPDGSALTAVDQGSDDRVEAYSVNKVAVAVAVLDKVDRGLLQLNQTVEVSAAIVIPDGDGIFRLDGAYPSTVTVGHALAALLTVSDDTSVRLCGLVCPALEINQILVAKGFPNTQVEPVANPNRFFLGATTPRETHDLLRALVAGTLLSPASTAFLLAALRSPIAYPDGIRHDMSSADRERVATKAGWFNGGRNEAGIMFGTDGTPRLTYAIFADGQADPDNFGPTHPATHARSVMGRRFLEAITEPGTAAATSRARSAYRPSNGG
ncbi:serine hydrolase [Micromonospora sp. NPDC049523]|uniref:serine hydrolase n=1 Tax=Micromonospora sp. NPDC049523 TaxID=3155921 RepID=UPI0034148750